MTAPAPQPDDSGQPTPLAGVLIAVPDADYRSRLAQWAAENRVQPNDPLWAVLHLTLLSDQWLGESLRRQEAAATAAREMIQAELKSTENTLVGQALKAVCEGREEIANAVVEGQQRIANTAAELLRQVNAALAEGRKEITVAMNRLSTQAAYDLQRSTELAIQQARRKGRYHWIAPIGVALSLGLVLGIGLPLLTQIAQGRLGVTDQDRYAMARGRHLLNRWEALDEEGRRQLSRLMEWGEPVVAVGTEGPAPKQQGKDNRPAPVK